MTTDMATPLRGVEGLRGALDGLLIEPGDAGYDATRAVWNGMIDRRPRLIVRAASPADAQRALRFARERDLPVSIRGGGHNVSGSALADDGLVIDHGERRGIRIEGRRVIAEPGVRLGDLDAALEPARVAVPVGINTTTGLAGLALGGGIGWRMRELGLTCDHLVAAELVLADGSTIRVDAASEPDLLWALRGGGGNFGIVTSFEFEAVPAEPVVTAGFAWFPLEHGVEVLRRYRDWAETLPRTVTTIVALKTVVEVMPGPPELKGRQIVAIGLSAPNDATGRRAHEAVASFGTPLFDAIGVKPFVTHQAALDPTVPAGLDYYWKSHYLAALTDPVIEVLVQHHLARPTTWSYSLIAQLGGAVADVPDGATAFSNRTAGFAVNINGVGRAPAEREPIVTWTRRTFDALAPHATGGVYVNFMGDEGEARVRAAYGAAYERLGLLKARYDPDNFFRINQNVAPAPRT